MGVMEAREKRSAAKFLKAAGVKPRPTQLQLLGDALGLKLAAQPSPAALAVAPAPVKNAIHELELKLLQPDPNNPRGALGDLKELVSSIEKVGILEPLIVRPVKTSFRTGKQTFMVVIGHRRFAAGGRAGLKTAPCIVRGMTDAQALEFQLIENCQRMDLKAVEEADSYARLVKDFGHTPQSVAARVGKSKAWVIARLKLRALGPEGRQALSSGRLNPTLAVPVARIKDLKAQARFLERACPKDGPPLHVRAALELLHAEHARSLKATPFDQKDADLVPEAGPCTTCPRRSGAVDGLTDDLKGHDTCTGPECFDKKAKAAWAIATERYRAEKVEVLPIAKGHSLFKTGNTLQWDGPYVEASAPCPDDPKKRSWAQLVSSLPKDKVAIGAERVPTVIVADLKMKPRKLMPRDLALRALSDYGVKWAVTKIEEKTIEGDATEARERFAAERQEREVRNRTAKVLVEKAFAKTTGVKRPEALLMLELVEEQLQVEERTPETELDGMSLGQLLLRMFRGLLRGLENAWQGYDERLLELAERHGLDVKLTENAIKRELADAEAPRPVAVAVDGDRVTLSGDLRKGEVAHLPPGAAPPAVISEATARPVEEAIAEDGEPQPDPESLKTPPESDGVF